MGLRLQGWMGKVLGWYLGVVRGYEGSCNTHPTPRNWISSVFNFPGVEHCGQFPWVCIARQQSSCAPLPVQLSPFSCREREVQGEEGVPSPAVPSFPPWANPGVIPCYETLALDSVQPPLPAATILFIALPLQ